MVGVYGALVMITAGTAVASPINNPGQGWLYFDQGALSKFIKFSTGEALPNNNPVRNALRINISSTSGTTSLVNNAIDFNATAQAINAAGAPLEAKLIVNRIIGTTDASSGQQVVNWSIRATMSFRALNSASTVIVDPDFCQTSNFNITISGTTGSIGTGQISSGFTIPALDPLGDGYCDGLSDEINSDFKLGDPGATLEFNKYWAETVGGLLFTGS